MICANCIIEGQVQIGTETVLQPLCSLTADGADGKVLVGERNVIEEMSVIHNSAIGHGNIIQVGATIEDSEVSHTQYSISPHSPHVRRISVPACLPQRTPTHNYPMLFMPIRWAVSPL